MQPHCGADGTSPVVELAAGLRFPEGPAFDAYGGLWCVEFDGHCVSRWIDGRLERYVTGGNPNGLAFDRAGRALFCDPGQNSVRRLELANSDVVVLADCDERGEALQEPNDLAFDAAGNLIFTCPGDSRTRPTGTVHCLQSDGTCATVGEAMYFPNGLAFVEDGCELVVAETYRHRLVRGRWNQVAARWEHPRPWAEVGGPVGPDGMALGGDGLLYVAVYGQGHVAAVGPGGDVVARYAVPGMNPTNVAFDPSGRLGLVVTEAERGLLLSLPELGTGPQPYDGGPSWAAP